MFRLQPKSHFRQVGCVADRRELSSGSAWAGKGLECDCCFVRMAYTGDHHGWMSRSRRSRALSLRLYGANGRLIWSKSITRLTFCHVEATELATLLFYYYACDEYQLINANCFYPVTCECIWYLNGICMLQDTDNWYFSIDTCQKYISSPIFFSSPPPPFLPVTTTTRSFSIRLVIVIWSFRLLSERALCTPRPFVRCFVRLLVLLVRIHSNTPLYSLSFQLYYIVRFFTGRFFRERANSKFIRIVFYTTRGVCSYASYCHSSSCSRRAKLHIHTPVA